MFNSEKPSLDELPSTKRLIKSTIFASLSAILILFTGVLPAEYGIDPTGVGRVLGLTEMGEIKRELAEEAEADRQLDAQSEKQSGLIDTFFNAIIAPAYAAETDSWRDQKTFTLIILSFIFLSIIFSIPSNFAILHKSFFRNII